MKDSATVDAQHAFRFVGSASRWIDGLPLGNGRIGVMCLADPRSDRFILNHDTAWSGSPASEFEHGAVSREEAAAAISDARRTVLSAPVESDRAVRRLQERYTQSFMPFATLTIDLLSAQSVDSTRTLDFRTAEHTLDAKVDGALLRRTTFVSHPDSIAVIETRVETPRSFRLRLDSLLRVDALVATATGLRLDVTLPSDSVPKHDPIDPPQRWSEEPGASVRGVVVLEVRHNGTATVDGRELIVSDATDLDVFLGEGTTFTRIGEVPSSDFEQVVRQTQSSVSSAIDKGIAELRVDHRKDHGALYNRASMDLLANPTVTNEDTQSRIVRAYLAGDGDAPAADPALVALLWHYGRYLLIASSRPGTLPANLQGIWNDEGQPWWSGNYTTNINLQMNYWGAEVADLSELHTPLFDLIEALASHGTEVARRLYGARGWTVHHNTDAWAFASPVGMGTHSPKWAFWPMGGLWLVRHLLEHVRYGASDDAAERAWPLVRGAVEFALDWAEEIEPGEYGTMLSTSPEVNFVVESGDEAGQESAVARSASLDIELLHDSLHSLIELAALTGRLDDDTVSRAKVVLPLIPRPGIRDDGATQEWRDGMSAPSPWQPHVSPHYGLFPGSRALTDDERAAASRSLDLRGADNEGWPLVWRLALRARLREAHRVQALLARAFPDPSRPSEALGFSASPFSAYPWFQMDASFGFVGAFAEVLLQSHAGGIELLPALPGSLPNGQVHGLIARPGVEVDLEWAAGGLTRAILRTRHVTPHDVVVSYRGAALRTVLEPDTTITLTNADFLDSETSFAAPEGLGRA